MKKSKKRLDFLPNKLNKYSIRKFTVGTASILVGATLFLGVNNEAQAEEIVNSTNKELSPKEGNTESLSEEPASKEGNTESLSEEPASKEGNTESLSEEPASKEGNTESLSEEPAS
ncbi:YSIRK-type signal peptide-containing protein, partial [Staphylococcus simulans]|uniref:YSIRK-type signal peptide-containing protein n=2 Tax=Staphylococcus TaxID=1279 RepID=UPI0024144D4E